MNYAVSCDQESQRRGGIVPLMAVLLPVLLIVAGLCINVCYLELTNTELQVAGDAAGRAAGLTFARTGDQALTRSIATSVAAENRVAGKPATLPTSKIVFGNSTRTSLAGGYNFAANVSPFNAVQVDVSPDMSTTGNVLGLPMRFGFQGTQYIPNRIAVSTLAELDVCLVVDRSGSMAFAANEVATPGAVPANAPPGWAFGDPVPPMARWIDATNAVGIFLNVLGNSAQDERVGLATYNHDTFNDVPLTGSYNTILTALGNYSNSFEAGGTNIGDGLNAGANILGTSAEARPWAIKVIVLLTDGIQNWGPNAASVANTLGNQGIVIFTVSFSAEADTGLMQTVAEKGAGKHFVAVDGPQLTNAFTEIGKSLPVLLTK